jgi:hypothetical protein
MYKAVINKRTGEKEFQFTAELLSISKNTLENSKGTEFKIVTIKFNLPNGNLVTRTGMCYKKSYDQGVIPGESYLTTLSFMENGKPAILMSHLNNASQATEDDFAELMNNEAVE